MEGNNNETEKEPKPSFCERCATNMHNFGRFIYNPDTREVLGRGGMSWLKILSFYLGFYACLAGFWAICLVVFIKTLDPVAPTMQKMYSMMKGNPGMNYEPFLVGTPGTLIKFNPNDTASYKVYVDRLNKVLDDHTKAVDPRLINCSYGNGANENDACRFDLTDLGSYCTRDNDYGYSLGKPCVLLRINKVFHWQPNNRTFDDKDSCTNPPPGQPKEECEKHNEFLKIPGNVTSDIVKGYISVSCQGESDGDRDNIKEVSFNPSGGFPAYFYPYYNQLNYSVPLVMAQFDVEPGRVSLILCKVWTKDIIHDKNDLQGSIHFELYVGT